MICRRKRYGVFIVVIMICLTAAGEECSFQNNTCLSHLGCDSYTWTEDTIIIAHGYWYPYDGEGIADYSWAAEHYSLTLYDRIQDESIILKTNIPASMLDVRLVNNDLFLYCGSIIDGITTCSIEKLDVKTGRHVHGQQIQIQDVILDQLLYESTIYLFGIQHIYAWDIYDNSYWEIYDTMSNENHIYRNHAFVQNNILYFQDDQWICGYNIIEKTIKQLVCTDFLQMHHGKRDYYLNSEIIRVLRNKYHFIVLSNILYYYDLDTKATVMIDLDTMEKEIVSEDEFYFIQVGPDGIIAQKRVVSDVTNSSNFEYVYVPYVDKDRPTFDPDSVEVYPIWDRAEVPVILIGSGQYIIASNEGIAAVDEGQYYEKLSITVRDLPTR